APTAFMRPPAAARRAAAADSGAARAARSMGSDLAGRAPGASRSLPLDGGLDGREDLHVAGAAADVAGEGGLDVGARRARFVLEQRMRGDEEARRAEAALRAVLLVEGGLDGREARGRAEALHGRDGGALHVRERQEARAARLPVDEDGAGAAAALLAAGLGAGDPELLAKRGQERGERRAVEVALDAVDGQVHRTPSRARATSLGSTRLRYHADASASSCGSTSFSASSGLPLRSTARRRTACGPAPVTATRSSPFVRAAATARIV